MNPQTPREPREIFEECFSVSYAITGGGTYSSYYKSVEKALSQLQLWIGSFKKEIHEVPVNFAVLSHEEMADILHKRSKVMGNNNLVRTLIDEMKEKE